MSLLYHDETTRIFHGDAFAELQTLPDASVQTCVTSPPYWGLRDYGVAGQLGLEPTPELYVENMVRVFREVLRILKEDGTLWLNLGDSYAGSANSGAVNQNAGCPAVRMNGLKAKGGDGLKPKDLVGIPWRVAFALQADGWYLRSDIIWSKPNPMPESVTDRPTKSHEYLFLLSKSERYFYDHEAVRESGPTYIRKASGYKLVAYQDSHTGNNQAGGLADKDTITEGRNKRSVWTVATAPFSEAHFATFPPKLIEPCILAGSRSGDLVLDPFNGAGTTAMVSKQLGRHYVGIELNHAYIEMSVKRLAQEVLPL